MPADKGVYTRPRVLTRTFSTDARTRGAKRWRGGLDRLIISLDGTTQEVYQQYRVGGRLEKVLEGTRNVVRWRKQLRSSYAAHRLPILGGAAQ